MAGGTTAKRREALKAVRREINAVADIIEEVTKTLRNPSPVRSLEATLPAGVTPLAALSAGPPAAAAADRPRAREVTVTPLTTQSLPESPASDSPAPGSTFFLAGDCGPSPTAHRPAGGFSWGRRIRVHRPRLPEQVAADAAKLAEQGRLAYSDRWYARSILYYTRAIALNPLPQYYGARALGWLYHPAPVRVMGDNVYALRDAMMAVETSRNDIHNFRSSHRDRHPEAVRFLEAYFVRAKVLKEGQTSTTAWEQCLNDLKVVARQSSKIQHWPGSDPDGWDEKKEDLKEAVIDEWRTRCEERAAMREEEEEDVDEDSEEPEESVVVSTARLRAFLDYVNELKADVSDMIQDEPQSPQGSHCKRAGQNWRTQHVNPDSKCAVAPHDGFVPASVPGLISELDGHGTRLHHNDLMALLVEGRAALKQHENVVFVDPPQGTALHVIGDIHGQYKDLKKLLELTGMPSEDNWLLFNGDFVDRGAHGVDCVVALLLLKVAWPEYVFLARGNHEDRTVNEQYHFLPEVLLAYGSCQIYDMFQEVFNALPLAHIVCGKYCVIHGGLSREKGVTLADLQAIDRDRGVPDADAEDRLDRIFTDLLWSDPTEGTGTETSVRNRGCLFGADVTERFLHDNGWELLIRSHELSQEGYAKTHGDKCVTVFSAPNYCGEEENQAAFMTLRCDREPEFVSFSEAEADDAYAKALPPHPLHFNFPQ
eukprot:TRINITY_DN9225_c0_g4_i1.p1 TRINITY_DN9225_c0_g4~~TRINITY_DN9225_c0_g4_i1.p1  ORF type:complete len:710 (+),score=226.89 TRINITY_DN9225_c0_g4_i1:114-2243(+)